MKYFCVYLEEWVEANSIEEIMALFKYMKLNVRAAVGTDKCPKGKLKESRRWKQILDEEVRSKNVN